MLLLLFLLAATYIIVDLRKNLSRKTEFRLIQVGLDLQVTSKWTLLKRSTTKAGAEFVPMRKVLFVGEEDLTRDIKK